MNQDHVTAERGSPPRPPAGITVVLADDHEATRAGVRLALEESDFTIVAEVASADDAVEAAVRHRPAVCVLDLYMPGGGISAARRIRADVSDTKIVILTASPNDKDLFEALIAGAEGYLLKDTSAVRLPAALRGVLAGQAALPRALEGRLIEEFRARELRSRRRRRFLPRRRGVEAELTSREWEVVELISEHLPTTVVAQRLGISEVTVRRHISSVMHKLDAPDRATAVQLLSGEGRVGWPHEVS